MVESCQDDFLAHYKFITGKLKKKFLRKPNVAESSEQFANLANRCKDDELPQYAGLCWMAVAKCEGSLENRTEEAAALINASNQFLVAEEKLLTCHCVSPNLEHLQAAVSCMNHARLKWTKDLPLMTGLTIHTGKTLEQFGLTSEASLYYSRAADLQSEYPNQKLESLFLLATARINSGDYDGALITYNEIASIASHFVPFGTNLDTLVRCEVTRILLLLIMKPAPHRHAPTMLEKYTWIGDSSKSQVPWMSEELFFFLQSLVMSCQSLDFEALLETEKELWPLLSAEQKQLLRILVQSTARI
ncbi:unnamed protein product [Bemisia tabaci]|uniref:Factor VIII intron 22 protein n=2 Tax=Bemisia tabaci TaxID=7038 RepID=A0A9P0A5V8_BEMTA|nr:PREDICTED: factor VIII intron 22 protein-like isoform X2 [Bemisia tabaci]XP_018905374.1 PREDICTED: factor VIII intron 22 protein-like isoform X2 [Bemisia tabaci]CAH0385242.1 unnamed protein product [Bemisia tabaci]